jgi:transposase
MKVESRPSPLRNIMIRGTRRPRNRPRRVYAYNNKYHTTLIMIYLADRGIVAARTITERASRKRIRRPGKPHHFDYGMYVEIRSSVERFFAWMKSFRRIQIRYNRLGTSSYLVFLQLGCVIIFMRKVSR